MTLLYFLSLSLFLSLSFSLLVVIWRHVLHLSGAAVSVLLPQSADDVVDSQQHARAFHGGFQGLRFDLVRFPDTQGFHIDDGSFFAVDAKGGVFPVRRFRVFGAQLGQRSDDVGAAVLRQRSRDDF